MSIKVLGLESSCDDTAASIVDDKNRILSNIVIGQIQEHTPYRGVVPEIAARSHLKNLQCAIDRCLLESGMTLNDVDAIAATSGPGLIGGVIVGCMYGKALASALKKPFIAINHLEGHALTVRLTNNIAFPYLLLLVSGGHCQFVAVESLGKYKILGQTLDDAVGEAYDKVAKMMGLGFPGGAIIEQMAKNGNPLAYDFPRPLQNQKNCNMSFSGLKTAVQLKIREFESLSKQNIRDIAASFQQAVCDVLVKKTKYAIAQYQNNYNGRSIVVSGGVAANQQICSHLKDLAQECEYSFYAPPIKLCTDNAAMIAFTGLEYLKSGIVSDMNFRPRARWSLDKLHDV